MFTICKTLEELSGKNVGNRVFDLSNPNNALFTKGPIPNIYIVLGETEDGNYKGLNMLPAKDGFTICTTADIPPAPQVAPQPQYQLRKEENNDLEELPPEEPGATPIDCWERMGQLAAIQDKTPAQSEELERILDILTEANTSPKEETSWTLIFASLDGPAGASLIEGPNVSEYIILSSETGDVAPLGVAS